MSAKLKMELWGAVLSTGLLQPIEWNSKGGRVELLCRQMPNQEKPWLKIMDRLLEVAETEGIDLHVCRRYVRKNGTMVFGWHIGVTAKSAKALEKGLGALMPVLAEAKPSLVPMPVQAPLEPTPTQSQPVPPPPSAHISQKPVEDRYTVYADREVEMERVRARTSATPRPPEDVRPDPIVPTNAPSPSVRLIQNSQRDGKLTTVKEMPLPHVYREINAPKPGRTGGVKGLKA